MFQDMLVTSAVKPHVPLCVYPLPCPYGR